VVDEIFFEGGKVSAPIAGVHPALMCFDFSSLYPSLIIAKNICFTTLVRPEDWDKYDDDELNIFEIDQMEPINKKSKAAKTILEKEYDAREDSDEESGGEDGEEEEKPKKKKKKEEERIQRKYVFKFVKEGLNDENIGLGPLILKTLLFERKKVRVFEKEHNKNSSYISNILKKEKIVLSEEDIKILKKYDFSSSEKEDELREKIKKCLSITQTRAAIATSRQLAIKVSANSFYGFYGAQNMGKFSLIEGAMAITYLGRKYIGQAGVFYKDFYKTYLRTYMINRIIDQIDNQIKYLKKEEYNKNSFKLCGFENKVNKIEKELDTYTEKKLEKERKKYIKFLNKEYSEEEFKVVYGDTDSIMIGLLFLEERSYLIWEIMKIMGRAINGHDGYVDYFGNNVEKREAQFKNPLTLEEEKAMVAGMVAKKTYFFRQIGEDGYIVLEYGTDIPELHVKGLLSARRSGCSWIKDLFNDCLGIILDGDGLKKLFNHCLEKIINVVEMKNIDIENDLSVMVTIGANYANENFATNKLKNLMMSAGKPLVVGERVKCLYVVDSRGGIKVGDKLRTTDFFSDCWSAENLVYGQEYDRNLEPEEGLMVPEKIDTFHYIEKVACKPLDTLFTLAFGDVLKEEYSGRIFKEKKGNAHPVTCEKPMVLIKSVVQGYIKENGSENIEEVSETLKLLKDFYMN
jgi:DNA polymerase elongation subunit (family B)